MIETGYADCASPVLCYRCKHLLQRLPWTQHPHPFDGCAIQMPEIPPVAGDQDINSADNCCGHDGSVFQRQGKALCPFGPVWWRLRHNRDNGKNTLKCGKLCRRLQSQVTPGLFHCKGRCEKGATAGACKVDKRPPRSFRRIGGGKKDIGVDKELHAAFFFLRAALIRFSSSGESRSSSRNSLMRVSLYISMA